MTQVYSNLSRPPLLVQSVQAYQNAFEQGVPIEITESSDLRGRILRGKESSPEEFDTLGLPGRELVFIMGPDGLSELPGMPLSLALSRIGLMPDYVAGRIAQGDSFKLAVFRGGNDAPLATWDNALDFVMKCHPIIGLDIRTHREALKQTPAEEFSRRILPDDFDQIELVGPAHPAFMTTERYLAIPLDVRLTDPLYLRRWLVHTEHFGIVFRGDGYTQTPNGEMGVKEYLMLNTSLASLEDIVIIDLPLDT